jgi:iron(III) transport system permease protein
MGKRAILIGAVLAFAAVALLPLVGMLARSLVVDGKFSFELYAKVFSSPVQQWALIANSLVLALVTAALALAIGMPLGLLLGKSDVPARRAAAMTLTIPLLIPPYTLAVCWFNVLSPSGLLGKILPSPVAQAAWTWFFGLPGCVLVLVNALMPIVLILTMASLRTVNPRLEEAGRLIAGWGGVLRYITLPMILPGVVFGTVLVFLLALGEVGVPLFLRYPVFPVQSLIHLSAFYEFGAATAAATPLLVVTLVVLYLEYRWLRDRAYTVKPAISAKAISRIPLERYRTWAALLVALYALVVVVIPMLALIAQAASSSAWLDAWTKASDSLGRSLAFAAIGATILMILGFILGYLVHNRSLRLWRALDASTLLVFALPGSVIGVGLIALWNRPSTAWIYATPIIIVLGYVAQYTAVTTRITMSALANVPSSLEDAGQMVGAPWLSRVWHIVMPAAKPGLIAAWIIAFIFCVRDVGVSMLIYPPGADTLTVRILTLMANGAPSLIATLCLILIAVTLAPLALLGLLLRRTTVVQ